jgi:hypothetical protein
MRFSWQFVAAGVVFGYFVGCSPVTFERLPEPPCGSEGISCVQKCTGTACIQSYSVERRVGEGLVDILIVNDNSGSMSKEQEKMADRFPTFIQSLGNLQYRIAMTTTDISSVYSSTPVGIKNGPDQFNGNGALQDGNLIDFASGLKFIDPSTPNRNSLFFNSIRRTETIQCEQSGYQECPSDDERGIFAANLVLDRTANQFMRPMAHLAVIVLADEDERNISDSRSARDDDDRALMAMYPQESYDLPQTFIDRFKSKYPGKTLSVHSIIVKPGDLACMNQQSSQGTFIRGIEGYAYAKLSNLTGGKIGSICAPDFGAQLTDIGYFLQDQVTSLPFSCRPINDDFEVSFDPQPPQAVEVTADFSKMELKIGSALPPLTSVRLTYDCQK